MNPSELLVPKRNSASALGSEGWDPHSIYEKHSDPHIQLGTQNYPPWKKKHNPCKLMVGKWQFLFWSVDSVPFSERTCVHFPGSMIFLTWNLGCTKKNRKPPINPAMLFLAVCTQIHCPHIWSYHRHHSELPFRKGDDLCETAGKKRHPGSPVNQTKNTPWKINTEPIQVTHLERIIC